MPLQTTQFKIQMWRQTQIVKKSKCPLEPRKAQATAETSLRIQTQRLMQREERNRRKLARRKKEKASQTVEGVWYSEAVRILIIFETMEIPVGKMTTPDSHKLHHTSRSQQQTAGSHPEPTEQFTAIPLQNQSPSMMNIDSSRYRPGSFQKQLIHDGGLDTPQDIISQGSGQPMTSMMNRNLREMQQIGTTTSNKSQIRSGVGSSIMGSRPQVLHPIQHQFITESNYNMSAQSTGRDIHHNYLNLSIDNPRPDRNVSMQESVLGHRRHASLTNQGIPKVHVKKPKVLGSIGRATELKTQTDPLHVKLRFNTYSSSQEKELEDPVRVQEKKLASVFKTEVKIPHPKVIKNTYIPRRKGVEPGKSTRPVSLINLKPANFYLKLSEIQRREKETIRPVPSPRQRSPPTVTQHGVNLSSDTALDFHITDFLDYDRKVQLLKDKDNVNQLFKRQMDDKKYKYVIRNYRLVKVPRATEEPVADLNRSAFPILEQATLNRRSSVDNTEASRVLQKKSNLSSTHAPISIADESELMETPAPLMNTLPVQNSIINPKKYRLSTKLTDYSVIDMMDSTLNPGPSFLSSSKQKELNSADDSLFVEELSRKLSPKISDPFSPRGSQLKPESSIFSSLFGALGGGAQESLFDNESERQQQLLSATSNELMSGGSKKKVPAGPGFFDMPHFPYTTTGQAIIEEQKRDAVREEYKSILNSWYQPKSGKLVEKDRIKGKGYHDTGDLYTPNVALKAFEPKTDNPYPHLRSCELVEEDDKRKPIGTLGKYSYGSLKSEMAALEVSVIHPVTFAQVQVALNFNRHFLTHLEKQKFPIKKLPLELFEDATEEEERLIKEIEEREQQMEDRIEAEAMYSNLDGTVEWQKCRVVQFNPSTKRYLVEFSEKSVGVRRQILRLYLKFPWENYEDVYERRERAEQLREEAEKRLNTENFFITQMAARYPYLHIEPSQKQVIKKKIGLQLEHYDSKYLKRLILQAEAMYVHSILKSIIFSQNFDPHVKRLVDRCNVLVQIPRQIPYFALRSFEQNGGPIDRILSIDDGVTVLQNFSLIGNTDFVGALQYLLEQNLEILGKEPLFEFPFSDYTLKKLRDTVSDYKGLSDEQLFARYEQLPMTIKDFLKAARSLTHRFKKVLQYNYIENVGLHLRGIIEKDFNIVESNQITMENLNPYIVKLFEQIRLRMERSLFQKYVDSLVSYSDHLQSFVMRNPEFESQPVYRTSGLISRRIKINEKPFLVVDLKIKKEGQGNDIRFTLTTKPDLLEACEELFELNNAMLSACSMLNRMDKVVFPLLTLPAPKLRPPNTKEVEIRRIQRGIAGMLHFSIQRAYRKIGEIRKFVHILGKEPTTIILDLKRQTAAQFQEETSEGYESQEDEGAADKAELDSAIEDEDDRLARIEIPNDVYMNELKYLRETYWGVRLDVEDELDFDFFEIRCRPFKDRIATHALSLIETIETQIATSFLQKMHEIIEEFEVINGKVGQHVATIDDVIHSLEYIDHIQKPNQKIDLLTHDIQFLKTRFDFVVKAALQVPDKEMQNYYQLLNTPRTMRAWLLDRRMQLERERTRLSKLMEKEKLTLLDRIREFEERLEDIKKLGMLQDSVATPTTDEVPEKGKKKGKKVAAQGQEPKWTGRFDPLFVAQTAEKMAKLKSEVEEVEVQCRVINRRESLLGLKITKFSLLSKLEQEVKPFGDLWHVAYQWVKTVPVWLDGAFELLDAEEIEDTANDWWRSLQRLVNSNVKKYQSPTNLLYYILEQLEKFRQYIPMISALRTKGLNTRHWGIISGKFNVDLQPEFVTLQQLIDMNLWESENLAIIKGISEIALKEYVIENTLDGLEAEFRVIQYVSVNYRDKETWIIKSLEDFMGLFEEFTLKVEALKSNPYVAHFLERLGMFERNLRTVIEMTDEWQKLQRSWMYLEPIFSTEDIALHMPVEATKFKQCDVFFRNTIETFRLTPSVIKLSRREGFVGHILKINGEFELITRGLAAYLESKRDAFARFFFLSNEEIIEILGNARSPRNIQRFLSKIFEGIENLTFTPGGEVVAMHSKEGQNVKLNHGIIPTEATEQWLLQLEGVMFDTMRKTIARSLGDFQKHPFQKWVMNWPGQVVLTVCQILYTSNIIDVLEDYANGKLEQILAGLENQIAQCANLVREPIEQLHRITINSLITINVHLRNTVQRMIKLGCNHITDFEWMVQMKFVVDDYTRIRVRLINSDRPYGYEYLGNSPRLVITPLTDKCYRSLLMALHYNYGGSPEGPAGTGKTETTKDLAKAMAKQCFVFNCSSSLDYLAMVKFFKGLASSGAWSCFDEFNRIELDVLSIIAQIIISIQGGIRSKAKELVLEETKITFNVDCAIFITMNPTYAGRAVLPDNLRALFRPVSMVVPDIRLISEILLYSLGFQYAKTLANKITKTFQLARKQLSYQAHYQFGLRNIKIVLSWAGILKLQSSGIMETQLMQESEKRMLEEEKEAQLKELERKRSNVSTPPDSQGGDRSSAYSKPKSHKPLSQQSQRDVASDVFEKKRRGSIHAQNILSPDEADQETNIYLAEYASENKIPSIYGIRRFVSTRGEFENEVLDSMETGKVVFDMNDEEEHQNKLSRYSLKQEKFKRAHPMQNAHWSQIQEEDDQIFEMEFNRDIDLEEYLVMRAITDTTCPKLLEDDMRAFKAIAKDVFPQSRDQEPEHGNLIQVVNAVIKERNLQSHPQFLKKVVEYFEILQVRSGVLLLGEPLSGKSCVIQTLADTMNKSREQEISKLVGQFKIEKQEKLNRQRAKKGHVVQEPSRLDGTQPSQPNTNQGGVKITNDELRMLKAKARNPGVQLFPLNPKSLTLGQLMGFFEDLSHDWHDGVFATIMRNCAQDTTKRKKWMIFDGPVDPIWVENLNSVLDDNKKLSLDSGETIKLNDKMNIVFECDDLSNATMATVSRLGIIYMPEHIINEKMLFNHWLLSLPQHLKEISPAIDDLFCYLLPAILRLLTPNNLIYPVTPKWVIYSLTKIMNAFIKDYNHPAYNATSQQLKMYGDQPAKRKMRRTEREPVTAFAQNQGLYQNSVTYKPLWMEAFFLYALTWAVGTVLQDKPRQVFIKYLQVKVKGTTDELGTITQIKKKLDALHQMEKNRNGKEYQPSYHIRKLDRAPIFLAPIPSGTSPFDIHFDFQSNGWNVFDYDKVIEKEIELFQLENRAFHQVLVPSQDTIKFNYFLEANLIGQNNTLMMGPTGIGKSLLGKEMIFKGLKPCTDNYLMGSLNFSHITTSQYAQQQFEMRLERRRKGVYGPSQDFKFIFFVDDLMMPQQDPYGVHLSNELMRQWFDYQGWYDLRTLEFKKVEDIQFLCSITLRDSTKNLLTKRVARHFTVLGLNQDQDQVLESIFKTLLQFISMQWPSESHQFTEMLIKASIGFYQSLTGQFKPSPAKPHYIFNLRDLFRVFYFMHLAHEDYLNEKGRIEKLWRHELLRVFTDRFVSREDHAWIATTLPNIVQENFGLEIGPEMPEELQEDAPQPLLDPVHFSPLNKTEYGRYWDVKGMEEINVLLQQYLSEYNASHRDKINIVVFDYISEQLIKIHRILIAPYSNLFLVGIAGVGKNTLTRLATYITEYSLEELSITPQYQSEDWFSDIKRLLGSAGINQNHLVFNIAETQLIRDHFLENVASLLKNGEVPGIYNREEYESVIAQMAAKLTEIQRQNSSPPLNYARFVWKCKRFLHIVFSVSPVGASFRSIVMQHPACVTCTSVIWMQEWPVQGLQEIANAFIKPIPDLTAAVQEKLTHTCIEIHKIITSKVSDFTQETSQIVYFTPKLYVEMFVTYRNLLKSKREEISEIRRRYLAGVSQLEQTHKLIERFQKISDQKTPLLQSKQRQISRFLKRLKEQADILQKKKEIVQSEEEECREKMAEAEEIKQECEKALDEARPSLEQAMQQLKQLTKDDLSEMKVMTNPPEVVRLVAHGVCILLNIKPKKVKHKDGSSSLDYWAASTTKKFLADFNVLKKLITYPKENISAETIEKLETIMAQDQFNVEAVTYACVAARGMYFWLKAMRQYHYVWQTVKPQHEKLKLAQKQYQERWEQVSAKKAELEELESKIKDMKAQHLEQELEIRAFQKEIDDCVLKTNRATKLKAALGGQGTKWKVYARMLNAKIATLTGDALLGAALVTYLSVMTQKHRDKILFELHAKMHDEFKIDVSEHFLFNRLFGNEIKSREWVMNKLPMDSFSITNAIIMQESTRFPICIDPHSQANAWLKTQEGNDLIILKFSDSSFNKSLELGVKFGKTVLIENVGQHIDLTLYPLLRAHSEPETMNEHGGVVRKQILLGGSLIEIDSNFKLLMTCELYTPHFLPEVFSLCALINFIVTFDALRAQMLGIVVESQHPQLEERRIAISKEAFANIKNNKELEGNILDWISKDVEDLLDDEKLLEALHTSQKTSEFIAQKLRTINNTTQKINAARNVYIPVAYRAATLYFVVLDLKKLNPMYQFSLGWFTRLFIKTMQETESQPSQNRKLALDHRLTAMINNFSVEVFNRINTFIYDMDKLCFQYHLFLRILSSEDCLDRPLYGFFIKCATNQLVFEKKKKKLDDVPMSDDKSKVVTDILASSDQKGETPAPAPSKTPQVIEEEKQEESYPTQNNQSVPTLQLPKRRENQSPQAGQVQPVITLHDGEQQQQASPEESAEDSFKTESFEPLDQPQVEFQHPLDRYPWLTEKMKNQLKVLETIRPFKTPAITQHMVDCFDEWQQFFESLDQDTNEPPIPYGNIKVPDLKAYQIEPGIRKKKLAKLSQLRMLMRLESRSLSELSFKGEEVKQEDIDNTSEIGAHNSDGASTQRSLTQEQRKALNEAVDKIDAEDQESDKSDPDEDDDDISQMTEQVMVDAMVDGVNDFLEYTSQNPLFDERQKALKVKMNQALISLCVIMIIRPDKLLNAMQHYITNALDPRMKEGTPDKLYDIYMNETTKKTPILFMLGQGLNPLAELRKLKSQLTNGNEFKMQYLALGKGQGQKIESLILRASRIGDWVLLENMHLVANFLPNIEKLLNAMDPNNVRDTFRLFLTCVPIKNFPITLLRDCLKLTMSAAKGVKQNLMLILNPIKSFFFQKVPDKRRVEFKKIFFALSILHTVLLERRKFGPIGWNLIYNFSQDDFRVSYAQIIEELQVPEPTNPDERVNFRVLQYLISEINYGGRITNDQDIETLKSFVNEWIQPSILTDQPFYFSESEEYYIPDMPEGITSLHRFVKSLPAEETTDIFGLHPNAEIEMEKNRAINLIEIVNDLDHSQRSPVGDGFLDILLGEKQAADMKLKLQDLQSTLPNALNMEQVREKYPLQDQRDTLAIQLVREVEKYNAIIGAIKIPLDNAIKAVSGAIYMSSELESLCASLFIDQIPPSWLRLSYPCFPRLGWFMSNLKKRVEYIKEWVENGHPTQIWLGGLIDPANLFVAIQQQLARHLKLPLEQIGLNFQFGPFIEDTFRNSHISFHQEVVTVTSPTNRDSKDFEPGTPLANLSKHSIDSKAQDSYLPPLNIGERYLCGLYMEGAGLDDSNCLVEAKLREQYFNVPPILVQALSLKELMNKTGVLGLSTENSKSRFPAPLYKLPFRQSETIVNNEMSLVIEIPVPMRVQGQLFNQQAIEQMKNHWRKRGVALLCEAKED